MMSKHTGEKHKQSNIMGELHIITGPMFSGKTTELLKRISKNQGMYVNHKLDIRYNTDSITSHDGNTISCISIDDISDVFEYPEYKNNAYIYLEEVQFFDDLKNVVLKMVEQDNKIVHCAGLLVDIHRNKFGELLDLVPHANTIDMKSGICSVCLDNCAIYTSNKVNSDASKVDVTTNNYKALCRHHYLNNCV